MMGVSPREPISRFVEVCRRAEELGFSTAWVADSQLITKDAYVAMGLAAATTERILIGPGVTNPVTRHFTTVANGMAAINEISDGRAILGIGVGDSAVSPLGVRPATVGELRQHVRWIRALAAGQEVEIGESRIHMRTANQPFPIFISASQPRMLQLAGEVADGVILMGAADATLTQWQLDHVQTGAERAGRTLDDVFVDLWFAISISDDIERARHDVRAWATSQARWFSRWKELPEPLRGYKEEFERAYAAYDFSDHLSVHAEHAQLISDDLVDLIAVSGPLDRCVERIRPLLGLKIDRITFALLPGGRLERLRQFGEELIPRLSAA